MKELRMYDTGIERVIAESQEDACQVWASMSGDDYVKGGYGEVSDWKECEPQEPCTMTYPDGDIALIMTVVGDGVSTGFDPRGIPFVTMTVKQWIESNGRGYFSCTEY